MRLFAPVVIALLAGIALSQATAQIGGPGSRVVRANSFVVENANGEIVAGLTSGWRPGDWQHPTPETYEGPHTKPSLFLRQDSLSVSVYATKYGASLKISHEDGPVVDIEVDDRGASVLVKAGKASVLQVAASGDQEAEVHVRNPNLKYDHHRVAYDIEGLQGHGR